MNRVITFFGGGHNLVCKEWKVVWGMFQQAHLHTLANILFFLALSTEHQPASFMGWEQGLIFRNRSPGSLGADTVCRNSPAQIVVEPLDSCEDCLRAFCHFEHCSLLQWHCSWVISNWRLRATLSTVDKNHSDTVGEMLCEKQNIAKHSPEVNNCLTFREAGAHWWIHHHGRLPPRGLRKGQTRAVFYGRCAWKEWKAPGKLEAFVQLWRQCSQFAWVTS